MTASPHHHRSVITSSTIDRQPHIKNNSTSSINNTQLKYRHRISATQQPQQQQKQQSPLHYINSRRRRTNNNNITGTLRRSPPPPSQTKATTKIQQTPPSTTTPPPIISLHTICHIAKNPNQKLIYDVHRNGTLSSSDDDITTLTTQDKTITITTSQSPTSSFSSKKKVTPLTSQTARSSSPSSQSYTFDEVWNNNITPKLKITPQPQIILTTGLPSSLLFSSSSLPKRRKKLPRADDWYIKQAQRQRRYSNDGEQDVEQEENNELIPRMIHDMFQNLFDENKNSSSPNTNRQSLDYGVEIISLTEYTNDVVEHSKTNRYSNEKEAQKALLKEWQHAKGNNKKEWIVTLKSFLGEDYLRTVIFVDATMGERRGALSQLRGEKKSGGVIETLKCVMKGHQVDNCSKDDDDGMMRVWRELLSSGGGDKVDVTVILTVSPLGKHLVESRVYLEEVEGLRHIVGTTTTSSSSNNDDKSEDNNDDELLVSSTQPISLYNHTTTTSHTPPPTPPPSSPQKSPSNNNTNWLKRTSLLLKSSSPSKKSLLTNCQKQIDDLTIHVRHLQDTNSSLTNKNQSQRNEIHTLRSINDELKKENEGLVRRLRHFEMKRQQQQQQEKDDELRRLKLKESGGHHELIGQELYNHIVTLRRVDDLKGRFVSSSVKRPFELSIPENNVRWRRRRRRMGDVDDEEMMTSGMMKSSGGGGGVLSIIEAIENKTRRGRDSYSVVSEIE